MDEKRAVKPRTELSEFLKTKRAELNRDDFGIGHTGRMRSKGLRREDIAHLAHVSLTWYTWLEQGRDINVSPGLLSRLANTLRLNEAERRYLFRLCGLQLNSGRKLLTSSDVSQGLARLLSAVRGVAFVINMRWDILAANRYAKALFDIDLPSIGYRQNVLELIFLDERHKALMPHWEHDARKAVAKFRLDLTEAGIPEMVDLVAALREQSTLFDLFWREAEVASRSEEVRVFTHPRVGELRLEYTLFDVGDQQDLRLNVYVPADPLSEQKLDQLLQQPAS
ncbi:helix-turn-helix transcriptional regulator [Cupriavidus basilensis]|uniref:helix-turn-helix transcriptional regulator n=1 Tax=Cupriavidus basilensis TaxID=68895 RepID=UPI000A6AA8B7|nr:helix-turn-helix transcriptional regulator [Cupriavidus basilensis]